MSIINLRSYGKINLSLDILGTFPDGYHRVSMVMHQIELFDEVAVRFTGEDEDRIIVNTNKPYIPKDHRNIAYKAAELMKSHYGAGRKGEIRVDIKKVIPVGAGLAGGSGNGGAVLLGLNKLWNLNLSLEELCALGEELGADVAFSIRGMAYRNKSLGLYEDPLSCCCALAEGKGADLTKLPPLDAYVVLSKPPLSVSTKEAYRGIDDVLAEQTVQHPDNQEMILGLGNGNREKVYENMINVLEFFTLKRYDRAMYTKNMMRQESHGNPVLMSGSGPTIFALFQNKGDAEKVYKRMKEVNRETFLTQTTV